LKRIVTVAALATLVLASAPAAGSVVPVRGAYSGATIAGETFSFGVVTKKAGPKLRPEINRLAWVRGVLGAVPISCNSGLRRSQEIGFPGPLQVGRNGRFGVAGVARQLDGDRVITRVDGRFTARRVASGRLSYRGGFDGEFCSGKVRWTAKRP
jgi:hypothetical protein